MSLPRLSDQELAEFADCFERTPDWLDWKRAVGERGHDVLVIRLKAPAGATLRLTKTENNTYMAAGIEGWGLTVGESLGELLDVLKGLTAARAA